MDSHKTIHEINPKTLERTQKAGNVKSSRKYKVRFEEDGSQTICRIPLDVYGKSETYRWRTAYDEAYNMDNEGKWK